MMTDAIEQMAGVENVQEYRIRVDHLRVGAYIRLEMSWFDHPFLSGSFKIKSQDQISTLKELGLSTVLFIPEKSDLTPRAQFTAAQQNAPGRPQQQSQPQDGASREDLWRIKQERIALLKAQRERIQRCEKQFGQALKRVKNIMSNLETAYQEIAEQATELVGEIVQTLIADKDVVVHLINSEEGTESLFYHSLNTAVLGLILGHEYGLDSTSLQKLGLGLLFHDIGKQRIPKRVLLKKPPLTRSEHKLIELHPQYGVEMISSRVADFPPESLEIIAMHHEAVDGGGYPNGLGAERIPLLVRLASIVDAYDNHCNKSDPRLSMTPYQALSYMFGKQNGQLDRDLTAVLVRCLGVYPPGTIVELSNGSIGLVVSVNSANSLRPDVLLYDPGVPKNEALAIPLASEPDLSVVNNIHPTKLPPDVYEYLNPRVRVVYFTEPLSVPKA